MTKTDLDAILQKHDLWVRGDENGMRANLSGADLRVANLYGANLYVANLSGADLYGANLYGANLRVANLSGADLIRANLRVANLYGADLSVANLSGADLNGADLYGANLNEANLSGADLYGANLYGANLSGTCLDPNESPNADVRHFQKDGEYVVGYRTREAGHIDQYRDGRYYSADWFSVSETECHPGLYLWPTLDMAKSWSNRPLIKVRTKPSEVHRAGSKWRCRWFEVIGGIDD